MEFRAEGPADCLAQAEGLGGRVMFELIRAEGPADSIDRGHFKAETQANLPGRWPYDYRLALLSPGLQPGLDNPPGFQP